MDGPTDVGDMSRETWGRWFARRGRMDIALLLFAIWDPIGVRGAPQAYDEYDGYAGDCLGAIALGDVDALVSRVKVLRTLVS